MKKQILLFFKNSLKHNYSLLSKNALAEEDKAAINDQIKNLEDVIAKLEEVEDDTLGEELKTAVAEMSEKITALNEKIEAAKKEQQPTMNFLSTPEAATLFCNSIRSARNAAEFVEKWGEVLSKNGISFNTSNDPNYLPDVVRGKIQDAWEKHAWLGKLKNTRAKAYAIRWNGSTQTSETSRAKGHKTGETKVGESLTFYSKKLTPQFVYKVIDIDEIVKFNDDGALLDYITTELVNQWMWEIGQAILVGDGRSSATPDLRITSITPIARTTGDAFVSVTTHDASAFLIDEIIAMRATITNEMADDLILMMSMSDLNTLRKVVFGENATPQYQPLAVLAEMIGVKEIIPAYNLGDTYKAIMFSPKNYVTAGEINPIFKAQENLKENTITWRYEAPIAGDVEGLHSAAVLKVASQA